MAKRQKTGAETPSAGHDKSKEKAADKSDTQAKGQKASGQGDAPSKQGETPPKQSDAVAKQGDAPKPAAGPEPGKLADIEPPAPRAEPWPDATPAPMKPVDAAPAAKAETAPSTEELRVSRAPTETMAMPPVGDFGKPPDMPQSAAPRPLALGDVESPTHMPGPKDIPAGQPDDPAPAPGHVPPGDSRSFRRGNQFALVYRVGTCVISRTGVVGTRGQWRVVEYPTSASASSSYAKECSRFVSEGFSDYRD